MNGFIFWNPIPPRRRGFTLLELLVVIAVIGILLALLMPAVQMVRATARKLSCASRLQQIGLALQSYHATHNVLPFGCGPDHDGFSSSVGTLEDRRYSAHSQLLPYLDQANVYDLIDFNVAPFDPFVNAGTGDPQVESTRGAAAKNGPAAVVSLSVFRCPSDLDRLETVWGRTSYRSCNGNTWSGRGGNGMFGQVSSVRFAHVRDGLSATALFSERCTGDWDDLRHDSLSDIYITTGIWSEDSFRTYCGGLTPETAQIWQHNMDGGQNWLEGNFNWTRYNHALSPNRVSCKNGLTWDGVSMSASSRHTKGVNVVFGDGHVEFVSELIHEEVWREIGSISSGAAVPGF